jgi:hypothetical protein
MVRKTLFFPFWLISGILKLVFRLVGVVFSFGFGTIRLVINRFFGTVFGALIGFFLGKNRIGVRFFTRKK